MSKTLSIQEEVNLKSDVDVNKAFLETKVYFTNGKPEHGDDMANFPGVYMTDEERKAFQIKSRERFVPSF